jgi:hypothetical protein
MPYRAVSEREPPRSASVRRGGRYKRAVRNRPPRVHALDPSKDGRTVCDRTAVGMEPMAVDFESSPPAAQCPSCHRATSR